MPKFRISYNLHKFSDYSSRPWKGSRVITAPTDEDAWIEMTKIRDRHNEERGGRVTDTGRRHSYIGMIDNLVEPA